MNDSDDATTGSDRTGKTAEDPSDSSPDESSSSDADGEDSEGSDPKARRRGGLPPEADPAAEFEEQPTGEERVGELLSRRYRLTEFIGRGAMGEVFRAEHALMKKTVAIKILHSDVSGHSKIVERFRREAQAAANIDHPNVCVATDFGRTAEKEFFLVMEFLEGDTLKETVEREGAIGVDRALYVANQICSALVRAHEVGVVHRDLKPDNIMLVERGDDSDFVKILDFGIARVRMDDETPELTKTGAVFGTPSYMSPEQAAGDPVDHRTDLYAIGSLLFEMLTGRRVFEADRGAEVMAKHVSQEPPRPSEHGPSDDIDEALEELVLELLEKNPDRRPQTAVELQRRLLALDTPDVSGAFPGLAAEISVPELEDDEEEEGEEDGDDEAVASLEESEETAHVVPRTLDAISGWFKRRDAATSWAALGLVAIGLAMVGTYVGSVVIRGAEPSNEAKAQEAANLSVVEQRQTLLERAPVREALRQIDRGAIQAGIDRLRGLDGPTYRDNPHLEYVLGRAYAEQEDWFHAVKHFERVLELEPQYAEHRDFLRDLLRTLQSSDEEVVDRVRTLVTERIDNPLMRALLARSAWRSSSPRMRRRTYRLLEKTGALEKLPKWTRRSIALRRARGCKQHRRRIRKLVELEDARGLQILRVYEDYPDSVVGCVREDIETAIRQLEELDDGDG